MEKNKGRKLRHRIHQWSIATLIKLLEDRPVHVVRVSERGSSSVDPFTGRRIDGYSPLVICTAVRGAVVARHRWEPHGVGLDGGGPMRCG